MPNSLTQSKFSLALAEAAQSQLRARYFEQRIATGVYKEKVGHVFHGFYTDPNKTPYTEEELLREELQTMSRHIALAEEHLDQAKSLLPNGGL
jgi:hypothetical protein